MKQQRKTADARPKSEAQLCVESILRDRGLLFIPECQFHPLRRWRFDYAVPSLSLAIEIEGGSWVQGRHNRGAGFQRDLEKYQEAAILGWAVLRFSTQDCRIGVVAEVLDRWLKASEVA